MDLADGALGMVPPDFERTLCVRSYSYWPLMPLRRVFHVTAEWPYQLWTSTAGQIRERAAGLQHMDPPATDPSNGWVLSAHASGPRN
jgi:hypothetical protein